MSTLEIPLFPLRTVLFPDGHLPLRIFEQRYLTMIRDCARNNSGFGVCLIREGEEAVSPVKTAEIGTHAQVVDWYTLEDGLLGVSTVGTARFMTESVWQEDDGLFKANITVVKADITTICTAIDSYMIENGDLSLTEIAMRLGYSELSAFSRAFHGWTGLSPSRYRSSIRSRQERATTRTLATN